MLVYFKIITIHDWCIFRPEATKTKRKKATQDDDTIENDFEEQLGENDNNEKIKELLPIKTKKGIVRNRVVEQFQGNISNL